VKFQYEYVYINDTIKSERRSYSKDQLFSVTKFEIDEHGHEVRTVYYDGKGNKIGWSSKNQYNKDHQKKIKSVRQYQIYFS
jgi:hypothetical protein